MDLDLFDLLDIGDEEEEKKKPAAKKEASKAKKKTVATPKYGLPLAIIADGLKHTLNAEEMGQQEVTREQILEAAEKRWPWYPHDIADVEMDEKLKEAFISYKQMGTPKGELALKEGDRFMFRDTEIDFSEYITEGAEKIEVAKLQKAFKALYPDFFAKKAREWEQISMLRSDKTGIIVPILPVQAVTSIPVQENGLVLITAKCNIVITRDEQQKLLAEKTDDEACLEDDENMEEAETGESDDKSIQYLEPEDIEKVLKEKGLIFDGRLLLSKAAAEGSYSTWIRNSNPKTPVAKEEYYPVEGVKLSLYYTRYDLSSKDFDGKEEVTKDELLQYLVQHGHPEYEHTDVRVSYIKKEKLILITTSGSKKGAEILDSSRYHAYMRFFRMKDSAPHYDHIENTLFSADLPEEDEHPFFFSFKLPPIPEYIRIQGEKIGKFVYENMGTEVTMDLYYSLKRNKYFWNPPVQRAMAGSVSTITEEFLEASDLSGLIRVGQGHSHGSYPAFFSGQDDHDERIPGLYFVWGSFAEASPSFCVRVSFGNRYQIIRPEIVFETCNGEGKTDTPSTRELEALVSERFCKTYKEPDYMCFRVYDKEILFTDYTNPYFRGIFEMCDNLWVYDLYLEDNISKVSFKAHPDAAGYFISAKEIVPWKEACPLIRLNKTGNRKTLIKYIIDCFEAVI